MPFRVYLLILSSEKGITSPYNPYIMHPDFRRPMQRVSRISSVSSAAERTVWALDLVQEPGFGVEGLGSRGL